MEREQQSMGMALQPDAILHILADLENCLEREAASLSQSEGPDLAAIAAEKSCHLDALLPMDRALRAFATPKGTEEGSTLLRRWFEAHGITDEMSARLQAGLASCQRLNQRNGALLRARQGQVALRLQVLGVLPEHAVYTAQGVVGGGRRGMTSLQI